MLAQWPLDILRPQLSFQNVMRRRIDKQLGPSTPDKTTYDPAKESKDTLVTPLKPHDEQAQLQQVNVLYSFMEDRYAKRVSTAVCARDDEMLINSSIPFPIAS